MCNLYSMTTNQDAVKRLFKVTQDRTGNLPRLPGIFPDQDAPVVRRADGGHELTLMRWGFPPPPKGNRPVTNVRNLKSPFWRSSLKDPAKRCLVPVSSFCEYTDKINPETKRKTATWFALDSDRTPFAFAGIWRTWKGPRRIGPGQDEEREWNLFAFLTTEPNDIVKPVHKKAMPVMLNDQDYETWLTASVEDALKLARPYYADNLSIVLEGPKKDEGSKF